MKNMGLNSVAYICIFASDFAESVKFYRDVLGLQPEDANVDVEKTNFYGLNLDNVKIGIEKNGFRKEGEKTKAENAVLIQFRAKSLLELEETTARIERLGVRILKKMAKTHYGYFSNFLDPDGNKLEILYQGK